MSTFENNETLYRMTSSVGRATRQRMPTQPVSNRGCGRSTASNWTRCCTYCDQTTIYRMTSPVEAADRSKASLCTRCCNYWVQKTTSRKTNSVERRFQRMHITDAAENREEASTGQVAVSTVTSTYFDHSRYRPCRSVLSVAETHSSLQRLRFILHSRSHASPAVIRDVALQASRDTACSGIVSPFARHPPYSNMFERFALCTLNVNDSQASNEQRRCKYCFDNLLTTTCSNPTTRSQSIGKACSGTPSHFGMSSYIRTITR